MYLSFFHGLESNPYLSEKADWLRANWQSAWTPPMLYREEPELFAGTLAHVLAQPPDLLIGSSMGGYFAYALATHTGRPALLFNPALHWRSIEPPGITLGPHAPPMTIVLGAKDTLILPEESRRWLDAHCRSPLSVYIEPEMEHRTPQPVFERYVLQVLAGLAGA